MPVGAAPFSDLEYRRRLRLTRKAMEKAGIELLFVCDPSNMAWLTGYDGWSFYVHQGVIVTHDAPPIWWGRRMDSFGALRTCWMEADHIRAYGDEYVMSKERHAMQDLAGLLRDLGPWGVHVGVEMENYYFSAKAYQVLVEELPEAVFHDATGLVNWQRIVKSPPELAFMKRAAKISETVIKTAVETAEPGRRKNEVVAEILHAGITGVDGDWGDYPAIVPLTPSGPDASAAHLTWNGDEMQSGEATFFELSGCYRRYHAPLCRTVYLGTPPKDILAAEAAQVEGIEAALEAAVAGNRTSDIAQAFQDVLARHGIERTGRCGYPVGLSYPPDWGERTASIRVEDDTELRPDMTFHFMPAIWMDNWGLETTETIRIRDNGPAEALCNVERKLFIKP